MKNIIKGLIEKANFMYLTDKETKKIASVQKVLDNPKASEEELAKAHSDVNRIIAAQLSGRHEIYHVWDKKGRFDHYVVDANWNIFGVTEGANALGELKEVAPEDVVTVPWKDLGFTWCPTSLKINGKFYRLYSESNGGLKTGTATFVAADVFDKITSEEYQEFSDLDLAKKAISKRNEASLLKQDALMLPKNSSVEQQYAANLAANTAEEEAEALEAQLEWELKNSKRPVAKFNQGRALYLTPSTKTGKPVRKDDVTVAKDFEVEIDASDLEGIDAKTFKTFEVQKWSLKVTDGLSIASLSKAKKLELAYQCKAFQLRDSDGSLKGLLVIVPDAYFETMKTIQSKLTWDDATTEYKDQIILFESVVKDFAKFKSFADYMANSRQLRKCEVYEKVDGWIHVNRQLIQMLALGADQDDIIELISDTVDELKELGTMDGYYNLAEDVLPATRDPRFEALKNSSAILNQVCKQVWFKMNKSCGASVKVRGAELFSSPCLRDVIARLGGSTEITLHKGECLVDRRCDVSIGENVVVGRMPYANCRPKILKVVGYTDVPGLIEFSLEDDVMAYLDADFDGDHIYVIWDERVVRMAQKTVDLCVALGVKTFVFEDVPASAEAKKAFLWKYFTASAKMGDVGQATSPIFTLASLVPVGATPETEVELGTIQHTVAEIQADPDLEHLVEKIPDGAEPEDIIEEPKYVFDVGTILKVMQLVKVAITVEADSGKRMAKGEFGKTEIAKLIAEIRKEYVPKSEFFAHPEHVEPKVVGEEGHERIVYESDRWVKNDGTRRQKELVPVKSAMNVLCEEILRQVTGAPNVWFVSDTWYNSYRTVIRSEENPDGFLAVPPAAMRAEELAEEDRYHGVPVENWFVKTGIDWYDKEPETVLDVDPFNIDESKTAIVDGVELNVEGFKKFILHGFQEPTAYSTRMEDRTHVSLKPNKWAGLSVGIVHHRLLRAMLNLKSELNSSLNKKQIVFGFDGKGSDGRFCQNGLNDHVSEVIRFYLSFKGIDCSAEQADIILYDELAKWLFSEHANESSASDLQYFFLAYKDTMLKMAGEE